MALLRITKYLDAVDSAMLLSNTQFIVVSTTKWLRERGTLLRYTYIACFVLVLAFRQ
jgi:hypothetical protein